MNNRLVIYFFFDPQGIVDDYNLVLLRDMMKNCRDLLVVSNGKLSAEGKKKFEELTDQILERENKGFDVWAYREAMFSLGWEKLQQYDEVILMNYTIMGPVFPFSEMFGSMDARPELDFWGITKFHMVPVDPYGIIDCGYIREHNQSHFIAVRKRMLSSREFHEYWENMPKIKSYGESVAYHESYFTHHFASKGYKWDVYVNTDDMKKFTEYPLLKAPKRLMQEKRCPIFKRRSFFHNYEDFLNGSIGEPTYELMEYLKTETDYDVELIWENILRCCNQALIKQCLHLNYVLPSNTSADISEILKKRKIALVMHLFYEDLIGESYRYACSMPEEADVFITVGSRKMQELAEKQFADLPCRSCKVLLIPNRGRDVGSVLVAVNPEILEYDYVCFAHDKKVTQLEVESVGASWAYECFESVLKNKDYVRNIIDTFEKNPRLGLLTPAPPNHADYFPTMGNEWGANFKATKALAKELGMHVPMSADLPPISALGCFFWYRPKAMKKLYDRQWKFEDFPEEPVKKTDGTIMHAIERLYSFAVQDAGYYPAWGFCDTVASIEITNLYFMLRMLNQAVMANGLGGKLVDVVGKLREQGPAVRALNDLHQELNSLFEGEGEKEIGHGTMMRLYYDEGEGFREMRAVSSRASFNGKHFGIEFLIPAEKSDLPVRQLRLDPGENGMLLIENFHGNLVYTDGSIEQINLSVCNTNGFIVGEKMLFIGEDPQIYIPCRSGKRVESVFFAGDAGNHIPQTLIEAAVSRKVPRMTPKLYWDCGEGMKEEWTVAAANRGKDTKLTVHFALDSDLAAKGIKKFRFDPSEFGMFALTNIKIRTISGDGSQETVSLAECSTNGFCQGDTVYFTAEDPQIVWKNKKARPCAVEIEADILEREAVHAVGHSGFGAGGIRSKVFRK